MKWISQLQFSYHPLRTEKGFSELFVQKRKCYWAVLNFLGRFYCLQTCSKVTKLYCTSKYGRGEGTQLSNWCLCVAQRAENRGLENGLRFFCPIQGSWNWNWPKIMLKLKSWLFPDFEILKCKVPQNLWFSGKYRVLRNVKCLKNFYENNFISNTCLKTKQEEGESKLVVLFLHRFWHYDRIMSHQRGWRQAIIFD